MEIYIVVNKQKLSLRNDSTTVAPGSQEFVKFIFTLSEDWDELSASAQFIQDGTVYSVNLDSENGAYLPSEITKGYCMLVLYGENGSKVATTNALKLFVRDDGFISDEASVEITQSLYQQLVNQVEEYNNNRIANDLTTTDAGYILDARQGKVLNDTKANIASPTFTGTPQAPTAESGTDSTQIATTEFVNNSIDENNVSINTTITDVLGDFATIESTETATNSYVIDDFLIYNSKLYKVISDIQIGDTLTVGTNIALTTAGDEISSKKVANNLTTTGEGYALDARQGKVLNDSLNSLVVNNLTTTTTGNALDASQGKVLNDAITELRNIPVDTAMSDSSTNTVQNKIIKSYADGLNSAVNTRIGLSESVIISILGDLATVEANNTTSQSYSVGDYLVYNNILFKVTASISSGGTITPGTNCTATTAGAEFKALNNSKLNASAVVNNLTTTESGYALDARQGKALSSSISALNYYYQTGLRFKNLGSSFTTAQQTALANGDFSDFWNGDYWVINGITWRIVDNTGIARRRGDTNFNSNSLIIMPDTNLVSAAAYLVDSANDSGNGYGNSGYRTSYRSTCKTTIANAFGSSHIASHRELMSSGRGSAGATGWAWYDADVELPSEFNIYGGSSFGASSLGGAGGYNVGSQWGQFALFRLAPYMAINRSINYWLRDVVNASYFAYVNNIGNANYNTPSTTNVGLRPLFILV